MQDSDPFKSLAELSKPADTLLKKISEAIGGIFVPIQIKRIAKAEAEATKIKAIALTESSKIIALSEIEIKELQQRALYRFITEETNKQLNIENITRKSFQNIKENAQPEKMENDWIVNFFERCKLISDNDMQTLWAKILADEANNPGIYSKRTVEFLSTMDKYDAQLFENLCSFRWFLGTSRILVYDFNEKIYNNNNISFGTLKHLEAIGLITFDSLGYQLKKFQRIYNSSYYNTPIVLKFLDENVEYNLNIGNVLLTKIGRELLNVVNSKPLPGFVDYIITKWQSEGIGTLSFYPKIEVPIDTEYEMLN